LTRDELLEDLWRHLNIIEDYSEADDPNQEGDRGVVHSTAHEAQKTLLELQGLLKKPAK
jgi:hypothetical protein